MIECLDDRIVEILCVKAREECRNGAGMWLREGAGEMLREDKCAGMLSQPASLPSTTCTATAIVLRGRGGCNMSAMVIFQWISMPPPGTFRSIWLDRRWYVFYVGIRRDKNAFFLHFSLFGFVFFGQPYS